MSDASLERGLRMKPIVFSGDAAAFPMWKMTVLAYLDCLAVIHVVEEPNSSGLAASTILADALDPSAASSSSSSSSSGSSLGASGGIVDAASLQKSKVVFAFLMTCLGSAELGLMMSDVPRGNAHEVWRRLNAHYEGKSLSAVTLLRRRFDSLMMNNRSVMAYSSELKSIMVSLAAQGREHAIGSSAAVQRLLEGLNSSAYSAIQTQMLFIEGGSLTLTLEHVITRLTLFERSLVSATPGETAYFTDAGHGSRHTGSSSRGGGGGRSDRGGGGRECYNCGVTGHISRDCRAGKPAGGCAHCWKVGHSADVCHSKRDGRPARAVNSSRPPGVTNGGPRGPAVVPRAPGGASVFLATADTDDDDHEYALQTGVVSSGTGTPIVDADSSARTIKIFVDSGASSTMFGPGVTLTNPVVSGGRITTASGAALSSPSTGSLSLQTSTGVRLCFDKAYQHSDLKTNLMSVSSLCESGGGGRHFVFTDKKAVFRERDGTVIFTAPRDGKLYSFDAQLPAALLVDVAADDAQPASASRAKKIDWHARLAHTAFSGMKALYDAEAVVGWELIIEGGDNDDNRVCSGCMHGKSHRAAFGTHASKRARATRVLGRVHADLIGPLEASSSGCRYMLMMVDEFTRMAFGVPLVRKSDAAAAIVAWCTAAAVQQGVPIIEFHTDGGGEFTSHALVAFFTQHGIKPTVTLAHTPQHNGIVERFNRTAVEKARSMMHHAAAPRAMWAECLSTAIYVRNRSTVRAGTTSTPEGMWHVSSTPPSIMHLRVFGCDAYRHVPDQARTKLDSKASIGIHLGYDDSKGGWRILDSAGNNIRYSRDVVFDEGSFTQMAAMAARGAPHALDFGGDFSRLMDANAIKFAILLSDESGGVAGGAVDPPHAAAASVAVEDAPVLGHHPVAAAPVVVPRVVAVQQGAAAAPRRTISVPSGLRGTAGSIFDTAGPELARGSRTRRPPVQLGMVSEGDLVADADDAAAFAAVVEVGAGDDAPRSVDEALARADGEMWRGAMQREIASLDAYGTFVHVVPPPGARVMRSKFVFKLKRDSDGAPLKYKARLVAQGFSMVQGVDYHDTFAPTLSTKSLRVVLALVAHLDYELLQFDVPTAFLNATMNEEVYMRTPTGDTVRLLKTLYGVKQAPREWNLDFNESIVEIGYTRCSSDSCVYVKTSATGRVMILPIYVDDGFPACHSSDLIEMRADIERLMVKYQIQVITDATVVIGLRVTRDRAARTLRLDQSVYVARLLEQYRMSECKHAPTPSSGVKLSAESSGEEVTSAESSDASRNLTHYGSLVGALLYVALCTRPDIAHATGVLSRFIASPRAHHWIAAKRVLRYLAGTSHLGLEYGGAGERDSTIVLGPNYCDADWAGDVTDRKSTTGYVMKVNGSTVSWASRKQTTVSLSSAEAEYMAAGAAAQEVLWLRALLRDLGFEQRSATVVLCDNQAAIAIASDDVHHARTKHIDIRHHFIRDHVASGVLALRWVSTHAQEADVLTKALGAVPYSRMRDCILGVAV